ncbi:hypothetical protein HY639_03855 [Candidatus Woesearchaeota archaeon]|nr:hypothetical protein [Candidatus Woesearchaeota archaeon]
MNPVKKSGLLFLLFMLGCTLPQGKVTDFTGAVVQQQFPLAVSDGWNFIGLPATYTGVDGNVLLFVYNPSTNQWIRTSAPFTGGKGYMAYAEKGQTLTFTGGQVASYSLTDGINVISVDTAMSVADLAKKEGATIRVFVWENTWREEKNALKSGVGYFVITKKVADIDKDGIDDSSDKCADTPSAEPVGPEGCPQGLPADDAAKAHQKVLELFAALGLPAPVISLSATKVTITRDESVKAVDIGMSQDELMDEIADIFARLANDFGFVDTMEFVHKELGTPILQGSVSVDDAQAYSADEITRDVYKTKVSWTKPIVIQPVRCTTGDKKCDDTDATHKRLLICNSAGSYDVEQCAERCENGACVVTAECTAGQTRCVGTTGLKTCGADNKWPLAPCPPCPSGALCKPCFQFPVVTQCPTGQSCDAALQKCVECTTGETQCVGTTGVKTCGTDNRWIRMTCPPCPRGVPCKSCPNLPAVTSCIAPEVCDAAQKKCLVPPPSISITSPAQDATVITPKVQIQFKAENAAGKSVRVLVDKTALATYPVTTSSYTLSYSTSALPNGLHEATIEVFAVGRNRRPMPPVASASRKFTVNAAECTAGQTKCAGPNSVQVCGTDGKWPTIKGNLAATLCPTDKPVCNQILQRCAALACTSDAQCGLGNICVTGQTGVRTCVNNPCYQKSDGTVCRLTGKCRSGLCVGGLVA